MNSIDECCRDAWGTSEGSYAAPPNAATTRALIVRVAFLSVASFSTTEAQMVPRGCARGDAGLRLPPGFCAQIVADSVGAARHVAVAPNGDIFVALRDTVV
jgi:hypothetical protein